MPKITSGNLLSSAEYDHKTKTLSITFQRGETYTYPDVPGHLYIGLLDAESPGTFFHKNIKSQFKGTKQEQA